MNRGIRFRAYDKERNRIVDVAVIDFQGDANSDPYIIVTPEYAWNEDPVTGEAECMIYLKNAELLDFTGHLDKHGNRTYQGDVVRYWISAPWDEQQTCSVTATVVWAYCQWWLNCLESASFSGNIALDYPDYEIIGNKFENPELLGASDE